MELLVYSRPAIERIEPHDVPHAIISITTTDADVAALPQSEQTEGVLRLSFPDMVEPCTGWDDSRLFDREDAERICAFVLDVAPRVERLLVHCDAGMSRSPAVAAALSKAIKGDDAHFFQNYLPNPRVYRILLETWTSRHP